jgi:hypothetical protein
MGGCRLAYWITGQKVNRGNYRGKRDDEEELRDRSRAERYREAPGGGGGGVPAGGGGTFGGALAGGGGGAGGRVYAG